MPLEALEPFDIGASSPGLVRTRLTVLSVLRPSDSVTVSVCASLNDMSVSHGLAMLSCGLAQGDSFELSGHVF